ncbi:MAG: hypothetical protein HKM95_05245 [Inquilinus sp.]|nr:hypothetical protein [Inquilinus sp.]
MEQYVRLDVSLKETHFCVVDGSGAVLARGREATQPELLAAALERHAPAARVVVLETGGQSSWLHRELKSMGSDSIDLASMTANQSSLSPMTHLLRVQWRTSVRPQCLGLSVHAKP